MHLISDTSRLSTKKPLSYSAVFDSVGRLRAKREQPKRVERLLPGSQGQNLALNVLYTRSRQSSESLRVPYPLGIKRLRMALAAERPSRVIRSILSSCLEPKGCSTARVAAREDKHADVQRSVLQARGQNVAPRMSKRCQARANGSKYEDRMRAILSS